MPISHAKSWVPWRQGPCPPYACRLSVYLTLRHRVCARYTPVEWLDGLMYSEMRNKRMPTSFFHSVFSVWSIHITKTLKKLWEFSCCGGLLPDISRVSAKSLSVRYTVCKYTNNARSKRIHPCRDLWWWYLLWWVTMAEFYGLPPTSLIFRLDLGFKEQDKKQLLHHLVLPFLLSNVAKQEQVGAYENVKKNI